VRNETAQILVGWVLFFGLLLLIFAGRLLRGKLGIRFPTAKKFIGKLNFYIGLVLLSLFLFGLFFSVFVLPSSI